MMRIVMGRGKNRHSFDVPSSFDKKNRLKLVEPIAEDVKTVACRPALLKTVGLRVLSAV